MIKLYGKLQQLSPSASGSVLLSLTTKPDLPQTLAEKKGLLFEGRSSAAFRVVLHKTHPTQVSTDAHHFLLPTDLHYLGEGDVVRLNLQDGSLRVLFRTSSRHNSILLTEQCNHYCLMCSQPPKQINDAWLLEEARELIKLIPRETSELGFTGGEPTLYGDGFIDLLHLTKSYLPRTAIHILTNGRAFHDIEFARKYAQVKHNDMMVGIPLYSDDPVRHDYVVQSVNAFNETVRGILNLKSLHQQVEIRVVIHRQTIDRLVNLCEFIARNLLFVDHVALMGLEITGFTRANLDKLWIDPYEYKDTLSQAVGLLVSYGMSVSVYNHQRCLVNEDILNVYRKSISDWKNEYVEECQQCAKRQECGGLFLSAKQYKRSQHMKAFV
jgi:His-Xaa-Ser system radical SAM maturase HxsC